MAIPCPGSDSFSHIFGVGRNGPNPFIAFLRAFIVLILEIARSVGLRNFLSQKCDDGCEKVITGPEFSRFAVRLRPRAGGGWSCVMGGQLDAKIECVELGLDVTDEECLKELLAHLHGSDQKKC